MATGKKNKAGVLCTACPTCPKDASHFCNACDGLNMCPGCCQQHDLNSATAMHDVFGLCLEHGRPMSLYCRACGKAICRTCQSSVHKSGKHYVKPHRDIIDKRLAVIREESGKAKRVVSNIEKDQGQLARLKTFVEKNSAGVEDKATASTSWELERMKREKKRLTDKSQHLQERIDSLMKEKATVDERQNQVGKEVITLEEEKGNIAADVRKRIGKSSEKIKSRQQSFSSKKAQLKERLQKSDKVTSTKIVLDADRVEYLAGIGQKLHDSNEFWGKKHFSDLVDEVKNTTGLRFVPQSGAPNLSARGRSRSLYSFW